MLGLMVALVGCANSDSGPIGNSTDLQAATARIPEKPQESDIAKLIELMNDPDPPTRHQASLALAKLDAQVVPRLLECLNDERNFVREGAAKSLGRLDTKPKEAIEPLSRLLCDEDRYVRREAGDAMQKIGVEATKETITAIETLMSSGTRERVWAAERLGSEASRAKLAVPALTRLLNDPDEEVRLAATEALKKIDPDAAQ
jgi:HEAT repeat protein